MPKACVGNLAISAISRDLRAHFSRTDEVDRLHACPAVEHLIVEG